jgi:hypothetical protein
MAHAGRSESFQYHLGDLLEIKILPKHDAFVCCLLANLDSETAAASD